MRAEERASGTERLTAIEKRVARADAALRPLAARRVDIGDPDRVEKASQRPDPLDEAEIRAEAESALWALLALYADGDDPVRASVRDLFARHTAFRWAAHPPRNRTADGFRWRLLHLSAVDQGSDPRDELLTLRALCEEARDAGVDIRPALREVAELSGREDRFGMGSLRDILLGTAG
ncbi:hypothetical protein JCM4814A_48340 [Streptomyces phaeofaciens JCM 4814]|uniref:Uncharacterized protein n=1 Tax=Streptomyces phaeofaciens TaxID=68254 RepID=A0A918H2A4_9ACTN|nr:hypothetical protein [Streptomyces phaeofaciens]GGT31847.1 hypothetical protein GCM10010226_05000 [Streptomyces phaeofaciens]